MFTNRFREKADTLLLTVLPAYIDILQASAYVSPTAKKISVISVFSNILMGATEDTNMCRLRTVTCVTVMLSSHHSIYVLIDVYVNLGSLAGGGSTVNHQGQLHI